MRVLFKQAVLMNGKRYGLGYHEVPMDSIKTLFFHNLIRAGLVSDGESPRVAPLSEAQRREKLLERVFANKRPAPQVSPSLAPQEAATQFETPAPAGEPHAEEAPRAEKAKKSKKKR